MKTELAARQLPKLRFACAAHVSQSGSIALFKLNDFG